MTGWDEGVPGVLQLPSGRRVRGRGLRDPTPEGLVPEFGLYLQGRPPPVVGWPARWVRWPDMWLPADRDDAWDAVLEVWRRADTERVEVACSAGRGRTGCVLACLAVLDGVPTEDAVAFVRRHYHPRAVGTPWQRRYLRRFARALRRAGPPDEA